MSVILASSLLLTGCENKDMFGNVGKYVLKVGADWFGTGDTGVVGGSTGTEPQSNKNDLIFEDYDVKKVEKIESAEKNDYDFTGPANEGVPAVSKPNSKSTTTNKSTKSGKSSSSKNKNNSKTKGLILLTSGHSTNCNALQKQYEVTASQLQTIVVRDVVTYLNTVNGTQKYPNVNIKSVPTGTANTTKARQFTVALYNKLLSKKVNLSSSLNQSQFIGLLDKLVKYEVLTGGKGNYTAIVTKANPSIKQCSAYYRKHSSKWNSLTDAIGSVSATPFKTYVQSKLMTNGIEPNSKKLYKLRSTSGTTCSGKGNFTMPEYRANFETMKVIGKIYEDAGYKVIYGKDGYNDTKLTNGKYSTNKNMSLYASEKGAILHINVHWDSVTGSKTSPKGAYAISPGSKFSSASRSSKKCANAFEKNATGKNSVTGGNKCDASHASSLTASSYTTLNYATTATVILECGLADPSGDFSFIGVKNGNSRKNNLRKWATQLKPAFLAMAKAAS